MFANTNLGVMNLGFPDVCKLPPFAIPVPFPNIAMSTTHIPNVINIIIGGGMAENLLTMGTISNGDQGGAEGGLISSLIMGPDRAMLGSFKTMMGPCFASRLTSLTGQNGMLPNTVGISLTPAQACVIVLS